MLGREVSKEVLLNEIPMIGADMHGTDSDTDNLTVEFFPDRPDLYGVEGLARAMRAFLNINPGIAEYKVESSNIDVFIDDSVTSIRPYFRCSVISDIKLNKASLRSIIEMQEKLHITIGRKRSKMAIGIHDLDKIKPPFVFKAVYPHTVKFVPLAHTETMNLSEILKKHDKGVTYANLLNGLKKYPIITDNDGNVFSFPPIINSSLTAVTTETKNLFIDVTGNDLRTVESALNIVTTAMAERGGRIVRVNMHENNKKISSPDLSPSDWQFLQKDCKKFLGIEISENEIIHSLQRMGLDGMAKNDTIYVKVPSTRQDIMHVVDIYEDVAIGYGFEKFGRKHVLTQTYGKLSPITIFSEKIRDLMIGIGFTEAITLTFSSEKEEFELSGLPKTEVVTVINPITEDHTCLRASLFPSLLQVLRRSKRRDLPQKLFEIGDVVINSKRQRHLCAVIVNSLVSFTEIKSYVEALLREIKIEYTLESSQYEIFVNGRGAEIISNENVIGYFGEVSPKTITNFGINHPVAMLELIIQSLPKQTDRAL
ncbi:MAG: phenylalanine--tRNA ligase subunit beta [archaeon]|nr:phenylalanine--tRNA ligase subunit beta [archaeon]